MLFCQKIGSRLPEWQDQRGHSREPLAAILGIALFNHNTVQ